MSLSKLKMLPLIILLPTFLASQEILNEFQIDFEVKRVSMSDSTADLGASVFDLLQSIEITIALNDSLYLTKIRGPIKNSCLVYLISRNSRSSKIYSRVNGYRLFAKVKPEHPEDTLTSLLDSTIYYSPNARKTILGYSCSKASYSVNILMPQKAKPAANYQQEIVAYVMDGYYPAYSLFYGIPKLKYLFRIPLQFTLKGPIFDIVFVATDFKRSVDPVILEFDVTAFEESTPQKVLAQFPNGF